MHIHRHGLLVHPIHCIINDDSEVCEQALCRAKTARCKVRLQRGAS
jgi:hypothetical protein